jgi:nicotinamide-nucleotide amidase
MRAILIATGDEITQGDILNTTGPAIARKLAEHNIKIIKHVTVPDNEAAIQFAIEDALAQGDYVFTTGGLGPTSDDLTRFALAKALKRNMQFDADSWQAIVTRLSAYKLHVHEDNRRQAYFPEGAIILENPHGTARGCMVNLNIDNSTDSVKPIVFMLPGPPNECLPMFEKQVVPQLPQAQQYKLHWLLLGASEGETAAEIDNALVELECQTGYRADYPYLEIKVWAKNSSQLTQIETLIEPLVKEKLVSKNNTSASSKLIELIAQQKTDYKIFDAVTGGVLQSTITSPITQPYLQFVTDAKDADISITGLKEYWQGLPAPGHSDIILNINQTHITRKTYYRGASIRSWVTEWACWQWLKQLITNTSLV